MQSQNKKKKVTYRLRKGNTNREKKMTNTHHLVESGCVLTCDEGGHVGVLEVVHEIGHVLEECARRHGQTC